MKVLYFFVQNVAICINSFYLFQVEDLNSLLGHAFRLAYTAHIQKAGDPLSDSLFQQQLTPTCTTDKQSKNCDSPSTSPPLPPPLIQQNNQKSTVCDSNQCIDTNPKSFLFNVNSNNSINTSEDQIKTEFCQSLNRSLGRQCCNHFCKKSTDSHLDRRYCKTSRSPSHRCLKVST